MTENILDGVPDTVPTSEVEQLLTVQGFIMMLTGGIADGSWSKDQKLLISSDPEGNRYVGFTDEIGFSRTFVADGRFAPKTVMVRDMEPNAVVIFPMFEIDPEV